MKSPSSWNDVDRKEVYDIIRGSLPMSEGDKLLDIGCGLGEFLSSVTTRGVKKFGVDINEKYLDYCRDKFPDVVLKWSDVCDRLPFPDEEFDVVVSICVIEHVDNPTMLVREAFRVCRRGGIVCFVTPNIGRVKRLLMVVRGKRWVETDHRQGWDHSLFWHLLEVEGWKVDKILTRFVDCPGYKLLPKRIGRWLSYGLLHRLFPNIGSELYAFCERM